MPIELHRTTTADDVALDGLLMLPESPPAPGPSIDAFLLIHGTGDNFYGGGMLESFARQAVEFGVPVLRANTRGHDFACLIPGAGGRKFQGGAAFENVEDCRYDIVAWLQFLMEGGLPNVALVGHSLGAVKSLYAAAPDPLENFDGLDCLAGVVALSPPRFCHRELLAHRERGEAFRNDFAKAKSLVDAGQGQTLIEVSQPMRLFMTAAGYFRKYGPDDPFDYLKFLPNVPCPVLLLFGRSLVKQAPAFEGAPEAIKSLGLPHVHVQVMDDKPGGVPAEALFKRTVTWLEGFKV